MNFHRDGLVNSDFLMTDMECTGNEMSLEDCPHTSGNITCSRNEGAGVECNGYDGMIEKLQIAIYINFLGFLVVVHVFEYPFRKCIHLHTQRWTLQRY